MNKIKNDKYLRKNIGNTRSKHKTRKVQRGGVPVDPTQVNNSEETVLLLQQSADRRNKMKEQRFPMFKELIRKFKGWFIDKFTPGTADSMKKLEELTKIEERIESHENSQNVDENIDKFITEFKLILTSILQERLSELEKITSSTNNNDLQKRIKEINDILEQIKNINNQNFTSESKTLFESNKEIPEKPEKPSLTQRFKQGVSNMGKTVKNAATSAKDAVTSRFSRKNKNDNELKEAAQTEPTQVNNEGRFAKMKTATKERLAKVGTATKEGLAKVGTATKEGLAKVGTATKEGLAKVGTAFSNFTDRFTRKKKEKTYSTLPDDDINANDVSQPHGQGKGQFGGNKTRKNRQHQYIHEIKQNRNELFNKEMEIINSIRNFKHRHIDNDNDNTKKNFMKAMKRG